MCVDSFMFLLCNSLLTRIYDETDEKGSEGECSRTRQPGGDGP